MTTYTKNEQRIFNTIAQYSMQGVALNIRDFCNDELTTKEIRGVIASLVKKKKIWVDDDDCHESPIFWPMHSKNKGHGWAHCFFWTDYVAKGEEEFITDNEVVGE